MTSPVAPPINEPLGTLAELAVWVQLPEIPEDQEDFATNILMGYAVVIRLAGSVYWTAENIHPRAKLLYDLKCKNFFEHPIGAVSETVGPLSERYLDEVVQQFTLTPEEESLLGSLVPPDEDAEPTIGGLFVISTTRGELETHQGRGGGIIPIPYWRYGSKPIPYYAEGAFGSPLE